MSDSAIVPSIAGLAIGIVFLALFVHTFQSVVPITDILHKPQPQILPPRPDIKMIYNGTEYSAQAATFSWAPDMLYIGNVSDALWSQNATAINMEQNTAAAFAITVYNDTTTLPVSAVYVYEYLTNDFAGALQKLDDNGIDNSENSSNTTDHKDNNNIFLVDMQNGDYYFRANYQSHAGSISYYFRVNVNTNHN